MLPVKAVISRYTPDVVMASSPDINSVAQQQEQEKDADEEAETIYTEAEWNNHLDASGKVKGKGTVGPDQCSTVLAQHKKTLQSGEGLASLVF